MASLVLSVEIQTQLLPLSIYFMLYYKLSAKTLPQVRLTLYGSGHQAGIIPSVAQENDRGGKYGHGRYNALSNILAWLKCRKCQPRQCSLMYYLFPHPCQPFIYPAHCLHSLQPLHA